MLIESVRDTGEQDEQGNAIFEVREPPVTTQRVYMQTLADTDKAIAMADLDLESLALQIQRRQLAGEDMDDLTSQVAIVTAERQRNVDIRARMP